MHLSHPETVPYPLPQAMENLLHSPVPGAKRLETVVKTQLYL